LISLALAVPIALVGDSIAVSFLALQFVVVGSVETPDSDSVVIAGRCKHVGVRRVPADAVYGPSMAW